MADIPHPHKANRFLVYINGVRVPAISVNVSSGIFSPVNGTIEMAPHRLLARLGAEDRLQVAVFYLDSWYYEEKPQWALLFEAEVTGWSYVNQGANRSLTLTVSSQLTILTQLFFFFMSGEASSTGALAKPDHDFPNQLKIRSKFPGVFFTEGVHKRPIARPFDIIENIVKAVVGEYKEEQKPVSVSDKDLKAEIDRLSRLWEAQVQADIERVADAEARVSLGDQDITVEAMAQAKAKLQDKVKARVAEVSRRNLQGIADFYADKASHKSVANESDTDLQTRAFKLQASQTLRYRSGTSKSITHTGFYARHFRMIRFLEHWVASPYVEGRPGYDDPVDGKLGGGVFPLLRATNAKKVFKALVEQSGAKFGENGSLWNFLQGLFSTLYYEIIEIMAPPAHTADKYGLPYGPFNMHKPADGSPVGWAGALSKEKLRLGIGSYLTKPQTVFALPPACNTYFPSMWTSFQLSEDYNNSPTRAYFNRSSPLKKLTAGSKLTGYASSATSVGYPAVVDGHIDRASSTASSDMEFLIFPEEYYRGPQPMVTELPMMFTEVQKVSNSARFGLDKEALEIRRKTGELQKNDPTWGETTNINIKASEKRATKGHSTHALLFMLAENMYYKQKYLTRQGQVSGLFNPYVVAGFPMTVFDNNLSGMHMLATPMQVSHNLSQGGFTTGVAFSYARTFEDMFATLGADGSFLDIAPQEPVGELQDLFQYMPTANLFYSLLFRRGEIPAQMEHSRGKNVGLVPLDALVSDHTQGTGVMDYRLLMKWALSDDSEEARIITRLLQEREAKLPGLVDISPDYKPGVKLHTGIKPRDEVKALFDNNDVAMHYVSRPVCTLEDYIDFYAVTGRGTANLDPIGRGRGVRVGERDEKAAVPTYYSVIRQFIGGPGIEPGAKPSDKIPGGESQEQMRITVIGADGQPQEAIIVPTGKAATFADLPDSRKDWQALLLEYTAEIESLMPQGGHTTDPAILARRPGQ